MNRRVQFITPENIEVSYELAGIGSRFLAVAIDHLLQIALIVALALLGSLVTRALSVTRLVGGSAPRWVDAALILGSFAIVLGYFSAFEILWAGRTPGKRVVGLRVVRDSGYPVDPFASIVRNLVRVVDLLLPPPYGAGLVSIFLSADYKRLGDYAAGTIVIKERPSPLPSEAQQRAPSPVSALLVPFITSVDALTGEEFQRIRRFVERRAELDPAMQGYVAMQIVQPLLPKLGLTVAIPVQSHYADLLEAVERRYVEERGIL